MDNPPVALLGADLHLCRRPWRRQAIEGDADYALQQIVGLALAYQVPVIQAGDLLDSPRPDPQDLIGLGRACEALAAAGLTFWYIQGNHDRTLPAWPTALCLPPETAPRHLHQQVLALGDLRLAGLDYTSGDQAVAALGALAAEADVLVCHQRWADFGGRLESPDPRLADLATQTDRTDLVVVSGDWHQHAMALFAWGRAYSPGAAHRLAIDEEGTKGVFLLAADGTMTSLPLVERYSATTTLRTAAELEALLETELEAILRTAEDHAQQHALPEALARPRLRVRYHPGVEGAKRRVQAAVGERAHVFAAPLPPERPVGAETPTGTVGAYAGGGAVAAVRAHCPDGPARQLVERLLEAGERRKQALADYCAQWEARPDAPLSR